MTEEFSIAIDAVPQLVPVVRRAVANWLGAAGWPGFAADELVVAVSEAVTNSVEHAYRERPVGRVAVEVTVRVAGGFRQVDLVVTDFGRWWPGDPDPLRGNGLALIRALTADSAVETDERGTRVAMTGAPQP